MISCHSLLELKLWLSFRCSWEEGCSLSKASWYLQIKDWEVNTTFIGFGVIPSWTTWFLWFHKVHRVVKRDWRYIFFSGSTGSLLKIKADSYWLAVIWFNSEVWIERFDPCQTAFANGQYWKRWDKDSSFSWHKGHVLLVGIPLLFKMNFTSKLLWRSFQIKVIILIGSLIFQMTFHTHS